MTEFQPIGHRVLIDKSERRMRYWNSPLGIINPPHLTRLKILEEFQKNIFKPSIPSKGKECPDLYLYGSPAKTHEEDPKQIFQEFNIKEVLPQHIARPYIYVWKINKKISSSEPGEMTDQELEKLNFQHPGDWNGSTNLDSLKENKNSTKDKEALYKKMQEMNKEEREKFYQQSQRLLRRRQKQVKDLKHEFFQFYHLKSKFINSDQVWVNFDELQDFVNYLLQIDVIYEKSSELESHDQGNQIQKQKRQKQSDSIQLEKPSNKQSQMKELPGNIQSSIRLEQSIQIDGQDKSKQQINSSVLRANEAQKKIKEIQRAISLEKVVEITREFFAAIVEDSQGKGVGKISMRALVWNINKYYNNKEKVEQKFSLGKAKQFNALIHQEACYWVVNFKQLEENLKQMADKEEEALKFVKSLGEKGIGEKNEEQLKKLFEDRNNNLYTRIVLAKFFKKQLQIKQMIDIELVAKAFINKILEKSKDISLFQSFVTNFFAENEVKKTAKILKKEDLAEYLIKQNYDKEDCKVIIKKIVNLYKFAQDKKDNANIVVNQVSKEMFLEFLKVNLRKQDKSMRLFIKMMKEIQKFFENEIEVRQLRSKSAKKYEMVMVAHFILRYLQKIERAFLKNQWKIMCILKAIEENQLSQIKLEQIFSSSGIPPSFSLKFLASKKAYIKKNNCLCQEQQLVAWKIDLEKALGIYKAELQKMRDFYQEMGTAFPLDSSAEFKRTELSGEDIEPNLTQETKGEEEQKEEESYDTMASFSTDVDYLAMCESLITSIKGECFLV